MAIPPSPGRSRGASLSGLLAGLALILVFVAAGLSLLTRRRAAPGSDAAAWAAVPPPPTARTKPARPRRTPPPEVPVPPGPPVPPAHPAPPEPLRPEPLPAEVPTPEPPPRVDGPKVPDPTPDPAPGPAAEALVGPPPYVTFVGGPGAAAVALAAAEQARALDLLTRLTEPFAFEANEARRSPASVQVELDDAGLTLRASPELEPGPDPVADLVPPTRLLGPLLRDLALPVGRARRAEAVVALAALLGGDPASAARVLDAALAAPGTDGAAGDRGLRVLRAAAALAAHDLPAVHAAAFGLAADPVLGPTVRVLTGAALRADGNPPEAMRDFEAALAVRPGLWIARLLLAETCETDELRFADRAAAAYAAVLEAAPNEPAAVLGRAAGRARSEPAEARADLERLLRARPGVAAAWRLLAWVRASGKTSDDVQAAVAALERAVALVPDDPTAWAELGGARWRWAGTGGGWPALLAAAEAYARQTDLAPTDGTAWFRRGAAIHQAAIDRPGSPGGPGGPSGGDALRTRLLEAKACYQRALDLGLPREEAARVHFNLGLVAEVVPATSAPTSLPSAAYEAAVAADGAYLPAGFALVAARVAERDGGAAERALLRLPALGDDAAREVREEQGVLEAAVAWAKNDLARVPTALTGAGVAAVGTDPVPALARALLVLGYRRAAIAVLSGETRDPVRLTLRVRALAGLRDAAATQSEWDRLRAADRAVADAVRKEPEVAALLP